MVYVNFQISPHNCRPGLQTHIFRTLLILPKAILPARPTASHYPPQSLSSSSLLKFIFFLYFKFFFQCLCIFERQRETEREQGRGRERGRRRIWNRLQAPHSQHRAWRGVWTHKLWDHDLGLSWTPNRLSHPGTPIFFFTLTCTNFIVFSYEVITREWHATPYFDRCPFSTS